MKHILYTLLIILDGIQSNAQTSKEYKFTTEEQDSISNFTVHFPTNWYITNETKGTPYSVIGIELSSQQTFQLTPCSPEMRVGVSIYRSTIGEVLEKLGLHNNENNICLFKDADDYVSIIVLFNQKRDNINLVSFSINKLTSCPTNVESKKKKSKRQTSKKEFLLFSYENTTICIELSNEGLAEEVVNLIKTSFKINT